jgi:hypothetical protein
MHQATEQLPTNSSVHLEELCVFVHGVLTAFHVLGIAHNVRKRNWFDTGMHTASAIYDLYAVADHVRQLQKELLAEPTSAKGIQ